MKIAHIINPVNVKPNSNLGIAQPITFKTMEIAKDHVKNTIDVKLYSAQYKEDRVAVPAGFIMTPDLKESVLDYGKFNIPRKLPILDDIIRRLHHYSNEDYLIYTNADIALMPNFYQEVARYIDDGHDAIEITRRTIPSTYSDVSQIKKMFKLKGKKHPGHDCFVFHASLFQRMFELAKVCIGAPAVGKCMLLNLRCFAKKFIRVTDRHLTFHIGDDKIWNKYADYKEYNRSEYRKAHNRLLVRHAIPNRLLEWAEL